VLDCSGGSSINIIATLLTSPPSLLIPTNPLLHVHLPGAAQHCYTHPIHSFSTPHPTSTFLLYTNTHPHRFIRQVLDRSGGSSINIISKIENEAGLENYDDILSVTDGIMVARGDLAMEVRGAVCLI
jgi:hypothetical protein